MTSCCQGTWAPILGSTCAQDLMGASHQPTLVSAPKSTRQEKKKKERPNTEAGSSCEVQQACLRPQGHRSHRSQVQFTRLPRVTQPGQAGSTGPRWLHGRGPGTRLHEHPEEQVRK